MKIQLTLLPHSEEVMLSPEVGKCCITITALARALAIRRDGNGSAKATPEDTLAAATLYAAKAVTNSDFTLIPHKSTPPQKSG